MPVDILDAALVHEAVVLRRARQRAACGERLIGEIVDLRAAVA